MSGVVPDEAAFSAFVAEAEPRLRRALAALRGVDDGRDAVAEALAWAWQHWDRVETMANPVGYLYRVGQSRSRSRLDGHLPPSDHGRIPEVEPRLDEALASLSETQRTVVVSSADEVDDYLDSVTDRAMRAIALPAVVVSTFGDDAGDRTARTREHLGLDAAQIYAWAEWGDSGDSVVILQGEFDPSAVENAARSRPTPLTFSDHQHREVPYFSWGEGTDTGAGAPGNPSGGPQHIAATDDLVIVTTTAEEIERLIDVVLDHGDDTTPRNDLGLGLAAAVSEMSTAGSAWDITSFSSEMGGGVRFVAWAGVHQQAGSGGYEGATFAIYEFESEADAAAAPDNFDAALDAMSDQLGPDEPALVREHTDLEVDSTRVTLRLLPDAWSGDRTSAFAFNDLVRALVAPPEVDDAPPVMATVEVDDGTYVATGWGEEIWPRIELGDSGDRVELELSIRFEGQEADDAAMEDGVVDGPDELPNPYYLRPLDIGPISLPIGEDVTPRALVDDLTGLRDATWEEFALVYDGERGSDAGSMQWWPLEVVIVDGVIIGLDQLYLP